MGVKCHHILEKNNKQTMGYPFCNTEITRLYLCKDLKTMCIHSNCIYLIIL